MVSESLVFYLLLITMLIVLLNALAIRSHDRRGRNA
jgi:hypothetical protein